MKAVKNNLDSAKEIQHQAMTSERKKLIRAREIREVLFNKQSIFYHKINSEKNIIGFRTKEK